MVGEGDNTVVGLTWTGFSVTCFSFDGWLAHIGSAVLYVLHNRLLALVTEPDLVLTQTLTTTHALEGLKPLSVEVEEARERELEQKREQERSIGEGTAEAPLELGDHRTQSPPLTGASFGREQDKLYDAHGGKGRSGGGRSKKRPPSGEKGARGYEDSDEAVGERVQGNTSPTNKQGCGFGGDGDEMGMGLKTSESQTIEEKAKAAASATGVKVRDPKEGAPPNGQNGTQPEPKTNPAANATVARCTRGKRGRNPVDNKPEAGSKAAETKKSRAFRELGNHNRPGNRE